MTLSDLDGVSGGVVVFESVAVKSSVIDRLLLRVGVAVSVKEAVVVQVGVGGGVMVRETEGDSVALHVPSYDVDAVASEVGVAV